ncbi:MAG: GAF domain-containing protein [Anaerolineae bacterium]|nr:GAF domain-containing protein [Anaerolineae bacterium]
MLTPLNVLMLEDRPSDAELIIYELRQAGFEPNWKCVETETDYIAHLNSEVDLILSDYTLPAFDALHALHGLQKRGLDIPFVVVTGTISEEAAVACMREGADDYLLKDRLARLGTAVRQALEQKALRQGKTQAQTALRKSEARFRLLAENTSDIVCLHTPDGRYIYISPSFKQVLGYEIDWICGQDPFALFHPEDADVVREKIEQAVRNDQPLSKVSYRMRHHSGGYIWLETAVQPVYDESGQISHLVTSSRDITERKKAEEKLEQRAAQLALINEIGGQIAAVLELETLLTRAARLVKESFDYHHVALFLIEGEVLRLKAVAGSYDQYFPEDHSQSLTKGINGWVARNGEKLVANDVQNEPRYTSLIAEHSVTQAELCLPIKVAGQTVGVLDIQSPHRNAFGKNDIIAMEALTNQIAVAIKNAHLYEQAQQEIIEHRETEKALRESEERFRQVITSISHHVYMTEVTAEQIIVNRYLSPNVENLTGYPLAEFLSNGGFWSSTVIHPDDHGLEVAHLARLARGKNNQIEYRLIKANGDVIWVLDNAHVESSGTSQIIYGVVSDITERKQAEEEIVRLYQAERARYQETETLRQAALALASIVDMDQVVESVLIHLQKVVNYDGASLLLLQGDVLKVIGTQGLLKPHKEVGHKILVSDNPNAVVILEGTEPRIINATLDDLLNTDYSTDRAKNAVYSWLGVPLRLGERAIGILCLNKHEPDFYTETHARLASAYAAQAVIAIENARLHTETNQRAHQLAVIHELDHAITASLRIDDVYQVFARHTKRLISYHAMSIILRDNDSVSVAFGAGINSLPVGKTIPLKNSAVGLVITQGQPMIRNNISADIRFSEDEEIISHGTHSEMIIPLRVKRSVIGTWNIGHQQIGAYNPDDLGVVQSMADQLALAIENAQLFEQAQQEIADRKQAQEELEAERASLAYRIEERTSELQVANNELARASRLKDEFLASMSHELRTPLNAILGMAEILQDQVYGPVTEKQVKSIRTIEHSGRHLLSLINDILDLSKIGAGKLSLNPNPVVVKNVCEASLQFVKQMAHKSRVKVQANYDDVVQTLLADELRLKQILVNLLSNAVKFTPEGGRVGLDVSGDPVRQMAKFTVWDTGIGIAHEDMGKLFQPFIQLDSRLAREFSGTGLGLSLVYRFTEMHGGSVAVESEVGQGSRFTVTLPWQPPTGEKLMSNDNYTSQNGNTVVKKDSNRRSSPVVLLAEDNEANIETMFDYLTATDHQVFVARNGLEATQKAQERHPDIILMDIQMPEMDGLEAIRYLRSVPDLMSIPVIALTALAMPGDRERCLAAGASDYLSKPVSLKQLIDVINVQLERRNVQSV